MSLHLEPECLGRSDTTSEPNPAPSVWLRYHLGESNHYRQMTRGGKKSSGQSIVPPNGHPVNMHKRSKVARGSAPKSLALQKSYSAIDLRPGTFALGKKTRTKQKHELDMENLWWVPGKKEPATPSPRREIPSTGIQGNGLPLIHQGTPKSIPKSAQRSIRTAPSKKRPLGKTKQDSYLDFRPKSSYSLTNGQDNDFVGNYMFINVNQNPDVLSVRTHYTHVHTRINLTDPLGLHTRQGKNGAGNSSIESGCELESIHSLDSEQSISEASVKSAPNSLPAIISKDKTIDNTPKADDNQIPENLASGKDSGTQVDAKSPDISVLNAPSVPQEAQLPDRSCRERDYGDLSSIKAVQTTIDPGNPANHARAHDPDDNTNPVSTAVNNVNSDPGKDLEQEETVEEIKRETARAKTQTNEAKEVRVELPEKGNAGEPKVKLNRSNRPIEEPEANIKENGDIKDENDTPPVFKPSTRTHLPKLTKSEYFCVTVEVADDNHNALSANEKDVISETITDDPEQTPLDPNHMTSDLEQVSSDHDHVTFDHDHVTPDPDHMTATLQIIVSDNIAGQEHWERSSIGSLESKGSSKGSSLGSSQGSQKPKRGVRFTDENEVREYEPWAPIDSLDQKGPESNVTDEARLDQDLDFNSLGHTSSETNITEGENVDLGRDTSSLDRESVERSEVKEGDSDRGFSFIEDTNVIVKLPCIDSDMDGTEVSDKTQSSDTEEVDHHERHLTSEDDDGSASGVTVNESNEITTGDEHCNIEDIGTEPIVIENTESPDIIGTETTADETTGSEETSAEAVTVFPTDDQLVNDSNFQVPPQSQPDNNKANTTVTSDVPESAAVEVHYENREQSENNISTIRTEAEDIGLNEDAVQEPVEETDQGLVSVADLKEVNEDTCS